MRDEVAVLDEDAGPLLVDHLVELLDGLLLLLELEALDARAVLRELPEHEIRVDVVDLVVLVRVVVVDAVVDEDLVGAARLV